MLLTTSMLLPRAPPQTESSSSKVQRRLSLHPSNRDRPALASLATDRRVWAFRGYDLLANYPASISTWGLPTAVKRLDAALYDDQTGKMLLFAGSVYYRCATNRDIVGWL